MNSEDENYRDNWHRITLRIPTALHKKIVETAGTLSVNASIVKRLEDSFGDNAEVREELRKEIIKEVSIQVAEQLVEFRKEVAKELLSQIIRDLPEDMRKRIETGAKLAGL